MKKNLSAYNLIVLGVLITLLTISLNACGSGDSDGNNEDNNGGSRPEASAVVGPSGSVVKVTSPSSTLYGVKIEIPPNALSQETTITISQAVNPPAFPPENRTQEIIVNIGPSGTTFKVPATVTIPYKNEDNEKFLSVFSAEEGAAGWSQIPIYDVDTTLNQIKFQVRHLTDYVVAGWPKFLAAEKGRIFIKEKIGEDSEIINKMIKSTIQEVMINGPWKEMTDCIRSTFDEFVDSEEDANIVIEWISSIELSLLGKSAFTMRPYVDNPFTEGYDISKAWRIVLNNDLKWHEELDEDLRVDEIDLFSVIAHEIGHILGWPPSPDSQNSTPDAITDGIIPPGPDGKQRELREVDKNFFKEKYPVIFLDHTPDSLIINKRPKISVTVKSPCNFSSIDIASIKLKLDDKLISHNYTISADGSEVTVFYNPIEELSPGRHFVYIESSDIEGKADNKSWSFEIEKFDNKWFEEWEKASIGTYIPSKNDEIQGDMGIWWVGDTISTECPGITPPTAQILSSNNDTYLYLSSIDSQSDCSDNIWVSNLYPLGIPITPRTKLSFVESGELSNSEKGDYPCYLCFGIFLYVESGNNGIIYVLQEDPDFVPISGPNYRFIKLDRSGGTYSRNLYEDFVNIEGFDPTNATISFIVFELSQPGWAKLDNISIWEE